RISRTRSTLDARTTRLSSLTSPLSNPTPFHATTRPADPQDRRALFISSRLRTALALTGADRPACSPGPARRRCTRGRPKPARGDRNATEKSQRQLPNPVLLRGPAALLQGRAPVGAPVGSCGRAAVSWREARNSIPPAA